MGTSAEILNHVGGRFVAGGDTFPNVDPVTGRVIAHVHEADAAVVDAAVSAARNALDGPWGVTPPSERARLLRAVAAGIEARLEDFIAAEVGDTGKPERQARELDVARASLNFRSFADIIAGAGQDSYLTDLGGGRRALNYAVRKPLGVVAIVVPWNLPVLLMTWKVAPALAAGNTVVVKPSEETPSTANLLAEVMVEAGIPDGVYNVVHGLGGGSAGELLTTHADIDGVTFTGESATGTAIMRGVAPRVLPVSFELGGKNAAVVFADADLDRTIAGLTRSVFLNTGQVCLCTERVYVERPVFDEVVTRLADAARGLVLGSPGEPETTHGPRISRTHQDKVLRYYEIAREEGATTVIGGGRPHFGDDRDAGFWAEPTLFVDLDNSHRIMREEVFGPVAGLVPFDTEDEAVALANDSDYGLAASTWTSDVSRAHRVGAAMDVGLSWVNTWYLRDLRTPFGGMGLSGIGREGGRHSLDFYTQPTNVCLEL